MNSTWDIFCRVVDNFGDIGVTWRLARQLANEHALQVRLWVDEPAAFARLCPLADPMAACQSLEGVEVRHWQQPWRASEVADVVVAAFGCRLPEEYLAVMARRATPVLWLNLEYLSAEAWVAGCHGLPSPQANGLRTIFFFPGFTEGTGGLLREAGLFQRRAPLRQDPAARQAFLAGLGVQVAAQARLISLFAYENPRLGDWLQALADDDQPSHVLVPEGRILTDLRAWFDEPALAVGELRRRGGLTVQVLPFLSQDDYDRLLWSCDFNAVRGEDSFVRAQWAGQPMLWHIYVQDENAHLDKLEAFLTLYCQGLSACAAAALRLLWRAWNMDLDMCLAWRQVTSHWQELQRHADAWSARQAARPDLATALVQFYRNWI